MKYLNRTKKYTIIIGSDDLSKLAIYIDAIYTSHINMRSHTGGVISFVKGTIHTKSSKKYKFKYFHRSVNFWDD